MIAMCNSFTEYQRKRKSVVSDQFKIHSRTLIFGIEQLIEKLPLTRAKLLKRIEFKFKTYLW